MYFFTFLHIELLRDIIEEHHLTDLALAKNRPWHTWFKPSNHDQSSRIYLIPTSMTCMAPRANTILLTFDHVYLEVVFTVDAIDHTRAMKDFILGSEEYLITSQGKIEVYLDRYQKKEHPDQTDNLQADIDVHSPLPDGNRIVEHPARTRCP